MPEYKSPQSEPGMEQRFLLVFLLMAVIIFGAQFFMKKYVPQPQPSSARPSQPAQPAPGQTPVSSEAATVAPNKPSRQGQPESTKEAAAESETVIENDLYKITFTNRGAQAKSWVLKKYFDDQGRPLDLVNAAASAKYGYPLSLWTYDETLRNRLSSALYVASA